VEWEWWLQWFLVFRSLPVSSGVFGRKEIFFNVVALRYINNKKNS
jgi:hypothetical protein